MATITLDYDARSSYAQKTLDYILSMGFFTAQTVRKSRRKPFFPDADKDDKLLCFASEQVLAKDWMNENEDEAWKNL